MTLEKPASLRPGTNRRLTGLLAGLLIAGWTASPGVARAQDDVTGLEPEFSQSNAAAKTEEARKEVPDIRVLANLVVTPVTVIGRSGEFVYDLSQRDFEILDNGVTQRIQSFESEPRAMDLVIVVETSRSVEALLDQVRPLGPMFSSLLLGPHGQAAVVTYGDRVKLAQDFSGDSDLLEATLKKIAPEGINARLNDALMRAIAQLERRPKTERRIVIAFSDGYDDGSESQSQEVIRRATGSEVAIYGLGFSPAQGLLSRRPELPPLSPQDTNVTRPLPPGTAPTPSTSGSVYDAPIPVVDILDATGKVIRSTVLANLLEFYAAYTGGVSYTHWKKSTLSEQLSHIGAEIQSQYELAYVPDRLAEAGFHRIEVKVHRPGMKVRARAGYFFQAPSTPTKTSTHDTAAAGTEPR